MWLILRSLTVLGLHASFFPHPIHGGHWRQASPPFGQWTPLFPRHPSPRYQPPSSHEDLSATATVNLESFAHQPSQFPKPIKFKQNSDSEHYSREFPPHVLQFSGTSEKQKLPGVRQLSKNPVNFFKGSFSSDDSSSAFSDVINPFLNKHVSVLRYPSDFVHVGSSSESSQSGRDLKNIAASDFGRPYSPRSPEVSNQELPHESVTKENDVVRYANNPLVSEFGRGLDSKENIRWSNQQRGQRETEKRITVQVDSEGIKFTPVRDNNLPVQTHSPPTPWTGDVHNSFVSDRNVSKQVIENNAKEHLEVIEDVNVFTHQTRGQATIVRLRGISLELPSFSSGKSNSSFHVPLPLHPIYQSNSNTNIRLIPANPTVAYNFSDNDSVFQSSESQRIVRKIVSTSGPKDTKYDKCSHAFHAWMCPQVLVTPQRQNLPNSTTVKSLIQSANFHAPNVHSFPSPVEISTTTESPRKKSGTIKFQEPITRVSNFPDVTARPTIRTTTQRRSGSTLFGEPLYTSPLSNIPHSPTSSPAAIPPPTSTEKNWLGSFLFDTLVTIPPLPSSKQYNKCSHSFHSWLCAKNPTTTSTAKPKSNTETPFSDSSFNVDVGSVPDPIPIPQPPESAPKTYSKCSHAFHSWLCPKQLLPVINRSTIPPPPTMPPKSGSGNFPETTSPRSGSINVPDIVPPEPPITTTSPPITTRRGSANFPVPQILLSTPIQPPFSTRQKVQTTTPIPQHKPYDKCSHAFHSWLCQKPIRTRLSSIAVPSRSILNSPIAQPKTTTEKSTTSTTITTSVKPKTGAISFSEPVNQGKSLFPVSVPDIPSTTTSKPTTEIDICSHPRHAWICLPSTTTNKPRGKSLGELDSVPNKIKKGNLLFPDSQPTISQPREQTTQKSAWDGADPCTHAFHSWLCKPSHRRLTIPSIVKPVRAKVAEASFPQNSVFLFSETVTSTTPPTTTHPTTTTQSKNSGFLDSDPQTTKRPEDPTTIKPRRGGGLDSSPLELKKKSDPCNHPFHSYLCTRSTTLASPVQRKPPAGSGRSFDASTSNTRPKPPKTGRTEFGDPSPPKSTPSSTPKYDKCSHPFHSWLCDVARNIGQESRTRNAAINAYIESDRFLLKTANLPNIRKLPLDTEETSQAFFPTNFINMNQVSPGQVRSSNFPNNILSTNFKVIQSEESIRSYQQVRASTPPTFEINFGQEIIPTLPTINSPGTKKFYNEESVTMSTVSKNKDKVGQSFNLNNISTGVPTVPPALFFNSPKMISFDINDVPTVPPRPAREIDSTAFQNIFANAFQNIFANPASSSPRIVQNNLSRSLSNSFVARQNASEHVASIPKILVSNPESGQQLHPSSPFLQFPSITNTASLETIEQKSVPASIIHSHFPDNIPSSTLDLRDNEPQGIFPNAHLILGGGNRSTNASKNENSSKDDSPRSNYKGGWEEREKSESIIDYLTSIDKGNGGNRQISTDNLSALQITELNVRQKQSNSVGNKQSLPVLQHQERLQSERAQDDRKQENHQQLINNQHKQLFQKEKFESQSPKQNPENVPLFLQTPKPNIEYLQLPIFDEFPLRQHEPRNVQNRGTVRHHYRTISSTPNLGGITPPLRNDVTNYQISEIWGRMEFPTHLTPVTQALKFESQRIRNSPTVILDQSSHLGGLHQAVENSETPFAQGTYPSSFLVPPPISNSNLQFQSRSDNGLQHRINRRQFSIIPEATNSRHYATSPENNSNNLRYLELVLDARKKRRGEQAEMYGRQWLYLKAVNPVPNYLEPLASNHAAITSDPLGVFKTSRYK